MKKSIKKIRIRLLAVSIAMVAASVICSISFANKPLVQSKIITGNDSVVHNSNTLSTQKTGNARNPIIWADFPDPAVIHVDDIYYMSNTTMHMCPGLPIMKSKDLVN